MQEKIIGFSLLTIGILIIVFSAFNVYRVFTGKTNPVDLFNSQGITLDLSSLTGEDLSPEQRQALEEEGTSLRTELVEPELVNKPLNLGVHLLLMGFLVNVGYKISSIGVQFLRPIKVKLREKE